MTGANPLWGRRAGHTLFIVLVGVVGATLAGCGSEGAESSSSDKPATTKAARVTGTVFSNSNFGFNFTYPKEWTEAEMKGDPDQSFGSKPAARVAVALDENNAVLLARYDLAQPVSAADLPGQVPELNGAMTQFAGTPTTGTVTEVGGLPAVGYDEFALPNDPDQRSSRVVFLFDGNVEYEVNCQSNPEGRDKVNRGCDQMLTTLRKK